MKNKFEVIFIPTTNNDPNIIKNLITAYSENKNFLLIDHYDIDSNFESSLKNIFERIFVIDDLANRKHDCDLLIDQNYYRDLNQRYEKLIQNGTIALLGPKYAIIRPEFRKINKKAIKKNSQIKKILVSFGGSDPTNECKKVLDALCSIENSKFEIIVTAGIYNHKFEQLKKLYEKYSNIKIYRHVNDLSRLMLNSDLFIGAGGTTTWERFYMGLPSIVTIISDDQKESIEFLSDMGHIINLGLAKNVTSKTYVQTLQKPNSDLIYNMSLHNQKLVDGNGSNRIKKQIIELINDA
jgi:UDP-2,4-diacetamido-2,4,6-trideoxy-beta-L-altropyranose hydrolase